MKVISDTFFIEREQLIVCHSLYSALNDSTPTKIKDLIKGFREWLGMNEGVNRVAVSDNRFPNRPSTHTEPRLKVLFSIVSIEKTATRT
jgi:uncharacterized protein (UPF0262 family)